MSVRVGDPATICYWSDREPATVTYVSAGGKLIHIQEDKATRTDNNGVSEAQEYTYERDPDGITHIARWHKKGGWTITNSGSRVAVGSRRKYRDFSF